MREGLTGLVGSHPTRACGDTWEALWGHLSYLRLIVQRDGIDEGLCRDSFGNSRSTME